MCGNACRSTRVVGGNAHPVALCWWHQSHRTSFVSVRGAESLISLRTRLWRAFRQFDQRQAGKREGRDPLAERGRKLGGFEHFAPLRKRSPQNAWSICWCAPVVFVVSCSRALMPFESQKTHFERRAWEHLPEYQGCVCGNAHPVNFAEGIKAIEHLL